MTDLKLHLKLLTIIKKDTTLPLKKIVTTRHLLELIKNRYKTLGSIQFTQWTAALNILHNYPPPSIAKEALQQLSPWRKGPFNVYGVNIDAEWNCQLKWERVLKSHVSFHNKKIIDIGCGNGYYLFRLSEYSPKLSIGIDPTIQFLMQFHAIQQTCQHPNIAILPMGYEDLHLLHPSFDIMLCMGLYYHHPSPTKFLKILWNHLPKKGVLIIETLILTTNTEEILHPKKRYANMKNISEIPSIPTLTQQLKQTGFKDMTVIDITKTTPTEQRATEWSLPQSLSNFLDPQNPLQTIEGYPAPVRAIILCHKP